MVAPDGVLRRSAGDEEEGELPVSLREIGEEVEHQRVRVKLREEEVGPERLRTELATEGCSRRTSWPEPEKKRGRGTGASPGRY